MAVIIQKHKMKTVINLWSILCVPKMRLNGPNGRNMYAHCCIHHSYSRRPMYGCILTALNVSIIVKKTVRRNWIYWSLAHSSIQIKCDMMPQVIFVCPAVNIFLRSHFHITRPHQSLFIEDSAKLWIGLTLTFVLVNENGTYQHQKY